MYISLWAGRMCGETACVLAYAPAAFCNDCEINAAGPSASNKESPEANPPKTQPPIAVTWGPGPQGLPRKSSQGAKDGGFSTKTSRDFSGKLPSIDIGWFLLRKKTL